MRTPLSPRTAALCAPARRNLGVPAPFVFCAQTLAPEVITDSRSLGDPPVVAPQRKHERRPSGPHHLEHRRRHRHPEQPPVFPVPPFPDRTFYAESKDTL